MAKLKWHMHAGGTTAPDRHGYVAVTRYGEYRVDPVSTPLGRPKGYIVYFTNSKGILTGGLWQRMGMFSHPNKAKGAAAKHYDKHFGKLKK